MLPCRAVMQMLRIRSVHEAQRLMVVDERLNVVYASDTLDKLLGTPVSSLTQLSLSSVIVPPAAQLHKRWISVSTAPHPASTQLGRAQ